MNYKPESGSYALLGPSVRSCAARNINLHNALRHVAYCFVAFDPPFGMANAFEERRKIDRKSEL